MPNYFEEIANKHIERLRKERELEEERKRQKLEEVEQDFEIISDRGHYTILLNGKFYCSADTYGEALKEVS